MPRYCASYLDTKTGRTRLEICHAIGYREALKLLPRWIRPNNIPMRRQGAPTTYKQE